MEFPHFILQISTSALTTLALIMLLAVKIHLEVMNVTASRDSPGSTVKKVGTINLLSIFVPFCERKLSAEISRAILTLIEHCL